MFPCLERHGLVDNRDGSAECGLYTQLRRIEQVRVISFIEAAVGIKHVARVAFFDLVKERIAINCLAAGFELARPALHPRLAVGLDEEFYIGVRADFRADVATIENGATSLQRKGALEVEKGAADLGDDGDFRRKTTSLATRQGLDIGELGSIESAGGGYGFGIELISVLISLGRHADGAVEKPGIEMGEPIVAGET